MLFKTLVQFVQWQKVSLAFLVTNEQMQTSKYYWSKSPPMRAFHFFYFYFLFYFIEQKPLDCKEKSSRAVHSLLAQITLYLGVTNFGFKRIQSVSLISTYSFFSTLRCYLLPPCGVVFLHSYILNSPLTIFTSSTPISPHSHSSILIPPHSHFSILTSSTLISPFSPLQLPSHHIFTSPFSSPHSHLLNSNLTTFSRPPFSSQQGRSPHLLNSPLTSPFSSPQHSHLLNSHLHILTPSILISTTFSPPQHPSPQHQWTLPPLRPLHPFPSCPFLSPLTNRVIIHISQVKSMGTSKQKIVWVVPPVPTPAGKVMTCSSLEDSTWYPHSSITWDIYFHLFHLFFSKLDIFKEIQLFTSSFAISDRLSFLSTIPAQSSRVRPSLPGWDNLWKHNIVGVITLFKWGLWSLTLR